MPILESVAQNIESTLAYTISDRVVAIVQQIAAPPAAFVRGGASAAAAAAISSVGGMQQASREGQNTIMLCTLLLVIFIGSELAPVQTFVRRKLAAPLRKSRQDKNNGKGSGKEDGNGEKAPGAKPHAQEDAAPPGSDFTGMLSHIVLLALSKIAMNQVGISDLVVDPMSSAFSAAFRYVELVGEIMFLGIVASCVLVAATFYVGIGVGDLVKNAAATSPSSSARQHQQQQQQGSFQSTFLGSQLDSLMVNLQRSFADAVGNLIPDAEARRMVVFLGLCMLPATSLQRDHVETSQHAEDNYSRLEAFFLMFQPKKPLASASSRLPQCKAALWRTYASLITKIWVTGISMAWINTTLGFILPPKPSSSSRQQTAFAVTINLVASVCLAFLTKALNNTFSGITVFQNYIEWNVATTSLAYIDIVSSSSSDRGSSRSQQHSSVPVTPLLVGLAFYAANELLQSADSRRANGAVPSGSRRKQNKASVRICAAAHEATSSAVHASVQTIHSTLLIMLTNCLVSYAMRSISAPVHSSGGPGGGIASLASVVAGMVVARTVMRVVHMVYAAQP